MFMLQKKSCDGQKGKAPPQQRPAQTLMHAQILTHKKKTTTSDNNCDPPHVDHLMDNK